MKTYNVLLRLPMLFFLMTVASCSQATEAVTTSPVAMSTSRASSTSPLPTTTPTVSPTRAIVSTLPAEEARKQLLDLLLNNGDCHLPCLWGITPGTSTYQDAQAILMSLSILSERTSFIPEGGAVSINYVQSDLILGTLTAFNIDPRSDQQLVSRVGFSARAARTLNNESLTVFDSVFIKERLQYYMLPNILSEYGAPTTVMVSTMAKLPSYGVPGGFKILILYPGQGILVNYTMQMQIVGDNIMGCPSNAHVELELYPPGHADSFFELLEPSGWTQIIQKTYKPIDEATSMSQDNFYEVFSQQTDQCIITPANLWPIPD